MKTKVLVIPDSHAKHGIVNDRYSWLGQLILDERPTHIINIGDFADMESLSSYDKGKRGAENKRYKLDIQAANDALYMLHKPLIEYNQNRKYHKKAKYKPAFVTLQGNHEHRCDRAVDCSPELHGHIDWLDVDFEFYKHTVVPYHGANPGRYELEGVVFAHYLTSGTMGRAISGDHHAMNLLKKHHVSSVVGHSHSRDFAQLTRGDGQDICATVVGSYFDHFEGYAGHQNQSWWQGVVVLENFDGKGYYDPRWIPMDELKKEYGEY